MLGLERNLSWAAVSEVGDDDATVTFAASLSKSLPKAEARHLESMELALGCRGSHSEKLSIQVVDIGRTEGRLPNARTYL